jgi:hypothetical protein
VIAVYTFKERGLLSPIAHDLRLVLGRFDLSGEGSRVTLVCHPATLTVDGSVKDGRVSPMSPRDRAEIERTIREEILKVRQFPTITFTGTRSGDTVAGELELVGRKQPLTVSFLSERDLAIGRAELVPSRWGIAPYKAMMGALRLQDRVLVKFDVGFPGNA